MRLMRKGVAGLTALAVASGILATVMEVGPSAAATCPVSTTIQWDGGAGTTAWGTAANWQGDVLPVATDIVCILTGAPGATVDVSGSRTVDSVFSEKAIRILPAAPATTATLTLKKASTISRIDLGSATALGTVSTGGVLKVTDFMWMGGTISGAGNVTVAGQLGVVGTKKHTLGTSTSAGRLVTAAGSVTTVQAQKATFVLSSTSVWTNSGTLTFDGGSGVQDDDTNIDSQIVNTATGSVRRVRTGTATDALTVSIGVPLQNSGTFRTEVGTTQIDTLRQLTGSKYQIPVRGSVPGSDFGVVTSPMGATLGGTLVIEPASALSLPVATNLDIVQAQTLGSQFTAVQGATISPTSFFRDQYADDAVVPGADLLVDTVKADLAIAGLSVPDAARAGGRTRVAVDVLASPDFDGDPNVTATITLPVGVTVLSAEPAQGSCTSASPMVCSLGPVDSGGDVSISLEIVAATTGSLTIPVSVNGSVPDPQPGNNSGAVTVDAVVGDRLPITRSLLGDFNGDTRPDRAEFVTNPNRFWVSLNTSGVAFAPAVMWGAALPSGTYSSFQVGKFTADTRDDIVVYNFTTRTLYLLAAQAGGGFAITTFKQAPNPAFTYDPAFIRSGDFNNDTLLDIATFRADRNTWYVYLSNGVTINAVSFSFDLGTLEAGGDWTSVAPMVGDFVGSASKYADVAVYNANTQRVFVLRALAPTAAAPNGSFSGAQWGPQIPCTVCDYDRMVAGDFWGNGKLDIAIWKPKFSAWYRPPLRANGGVYPPTSGSWTAIEDLAPDSSQEWTRQFAADFTGDGNADLANYRMDLVAWYVAGASAGGTMGSPAVWANLAPEHGWTGWLAADFTGDGKADLSVVDPNGRILVGDSNGSGFGALSSFTDWGVAPTEVVARQWVVNGEIIDPSTQQDIVLAVTNPNGSPDTVPDLKVTLPAGVTYLPGTTTGATTANPTVSGSTLTWTGPFTLAANATLIVKYRVQVASTASGDLSLDLAVAAQRITTNAASIVLSVNSPIAVGRTLGCGTSVFAVDPSTTGGGVDGDAGDVNLFSGSYSVGETDLVAPAIGADFSFERCYNSADATVGSLGRGWSHSYAIRVQSPSGGAPVAGLDVVLVGEDGQQVTFKASGGGWQRPAGGRVDLAALPGGGYQATTYDSVKFTFDAAGRLLTIRDRNDQGSTLTYDLSGRLAAVQLDSVTPALRTITFAYNAANQLSTVTMPDGRVETYTYLNGLLRTAKSPGGAITTYTYYGPTAGASANRLQKVTDPMNRTDVTITYNASGRVAGLTGGGKTTQFTWDPTAREATVVDNNLKKWKTAFNASGAVKTQTGPTGLVQTYKYDSDFNLVSVKSPGAKVTTTKYDAKGNPLVVTDPAGRQTINTWTPFNDIKTVTRVRGKDDDEFDDCRKTAGLVAHCKEYFVELRAGLRDLVTTYDYDVRGNLTQVTDHYGAASTQTVNPVTGLVESSTDALGRTSTVTYDPEGRGLTKTSTTPQGRVTTNEYDNSGRLTAFVDALGKRVEYTYDLDDNVTSTKYVGDPASPVNTVTSATYDKNGNVLTSTDALLRKTSFTYDPYDRLTTTIAPNGTRTVQSYDAEGLVTESDTLDKSGNPLPYQHSSFTFDDANRPTTVTDPYGVITTTNYDQRGRVLRVGTQGGAAGSHTTTFTYDDKLDRLTKREVTYATPNFAMSAPVSYHYDDLDRVVEIDDGDGKEQRTYDSLGRITGITRTSSVSGTPETIDFDYAYDAVGQLVHEVLPSSSECGSVRPSLDFTYFPDGMLQAIVSTCGATTSTTNYTYDAANRLVGTALPNGAAETRAYQNGGVGDGHVKTIVNEDHTHAVRSQFDYTYDAVGNVLSRTTSAGTQAFTYDNMDQLTQVCLEAGCGVANGQTNWTFDAVGNRTKEVQGTSTTTYQYQGDRLTRVIAPTKTSAYNYDSDGNVISIIDATAFGSTTTGYRFDADGHLQRTTLPGPSGGSVTYSYDGDGVRRSEVACLPSCASMKRFEWDKIASLPMLTTERQGVATNRYTYGLGGVLTASMNGTGVVYQHDMLGSVTDVSGATDQPYWSMRYAPYGAKTTNTRLDPAAPTQPFGFTGQYDDTGTNLQHLRARQYDTATGRFLSVDPLPSAGSAYAYVGNNPLNATDPSGMRFARESGGFGSECGYVMVCSDGGGGSSDWALIVDPVWGGGTASNYTGNGNFGRPPHSGSGTSGVRRGGGCSGCGGAGGVPCRQDPVCRNKWQSDNCRGKYNTEQCHYKKALARNARKARKALCHGNPAYCVQKQPTVKPVPKGWKPPRPSASLTMEAGYCFFICVSIAKSSNGGTGVGFGVGMRGPGVSLSPATGYNASGGVTASACAVTCVAADRRGVSVSGLGTPGASVMTYEWVYR